MSAAEKNKKGFHSQIAAAFLAGLKESGELSFKIHRLRDEIRKVIEGEDSIFGKFRGLVESFRDIIPGEKQRYDAAVKALFATSGLSRQDLVKAIGAQIEELKILEKGLMSALPGWHDELKVIESKSREIKNEISKLREKIGRLEREEKEIVDALASREKEMKVVEKAVREIFTDIGAEITDAKTKLEEFTPESTASHQITPPDIIKSYKCEEETGGGELESEIWEAPPPQKIGSEKKCPMCEGRMDFYLKEKKWICYVCAHEESEEINNARAESKHITAPASTSAPKPAPDAPPPLAAPSASPPSNKRPSLRKKTCPVCHKKMNLHETEKIWRCPFCEYERMEF